jgi:hypothetical protein
MQTWQGAEPLGELDGWLVLALAAVQLPGGSWAYTWSIRPGVTVSVITLPGPDTLQVTNPDWLEIIRDITRTRRVLARPPAVPDPGLP